MRDHIVIPCQRPQSGYKRERLGLAKRSTAQKMMPTTSLGKTFAGSVPLSETISRFAEVHDCAALQDQACKESGRAV